jgi:hypothetical protein
MFGPMKDVLRGRRISSDKEVIGGGAKLVKDATNFFLTELKRICETLEPVR